jgi:hypothetical protein
MTINNIKLLFILSLFYIVGCNSSILDDPSISIKYKVEEPSFVKLVLINSYDTEIATLVDEQQPAGNHEVSFGINDLAEGIYFYTLELRGESGSYSKSTKHLLLIK